MNATEMITVDRERVVIALRQLQLNLRQREELNAQIGASMLVSIRRTFREEGSPGGSWVPLAASTLRNKKYTAGHKLLVLSGYLLNSITYQVFSGGVVIGTNVKYARVQNDGSADRGGSIGPQARIAGRDVRVKAHFRVIRLAPRYERHQITRADGSKVSVPRPVYKEQVQIRDKNGRTRTVTRSIDSPSLNKSFAVGSHRRFQNIPARPFMVLRPEDPNRIRLLVANFANKARSTAGLGGQ